MGSKMFIADLIMGSTSLILLILFTYVTYQVVKLIYLNDKILLSMLIFLDLTLLSKLILRKLCIQPKLGISFVMLLLRKVCLLI